MNQIIRTRRDNLIAAIEQELNRGYSKHGKAQWGRHEFYAILKEEVDELWQVVKENGAQVTLWREAIQVAAVAIRFMETGDKHYSIGIDQELSASDFICESPTVKVPLKFIDRIATFLHQGRINGWITPPADSKELFDDLTDETHEISETGGRLS